MSTTDTNVSQVIVNKLTKNQYDNATKSATEFYAVTDGKITNSDIDWGTVYDVLYNDQNEVGTNTTFILSSSAANYTRLKVFFKSNDGDFGSVEIYSPDGKTFSTTILHPITGIIYFKNTLWSVSGSTITDVKAVQGAMGSSTSVSDASFIYITRVEGWKN